MARHVQCHVKFDSAEVIAWMNCSAHLKHPGVPVELSLFHKRLSIISFGMQKRCCELLRKGLSLRAKLSSAVVLLHFFQRLSLAEFMSHVRCELPQEPPDWKLLQAQCVIITTMTYRNLLEQRRSIMATNSCADMSDSIFAQP
jgi:hypothetical protein